MADPALDPHRLLALHRKREAARALSRAASDAYHDLREARAAAQLGLARAEMLAAESYRRDGDEAVKAAAAKVSDLTERMAAQQSEMAGHTETATRAGQAFMAALKYALDTGLAIPASLADEATAARPIFAMSGA